MRNVHAIEIECKTILNKCPMQFADYTLNSYQGCAFGCSYCYVPVMRARRGQVDEEKWGTWVLVKVNAPDVLRRTMLRIPPEARIAIGTSTDSWQPLEKKYEISRRILLELSYYPNPVRLLTRSPLLIRDIDILTQIQDVQIGVSVPTFDESIRRVFEPNASAIPGRINLVRRLLDAGLRVNLNFSPVLYGVMDNAGAVRDYVKRASELGVERIFWNTLGYTETLWKPHLMLLKEYRQTTGARPAPSLTREALHAEFKKVGEGLKVSCGC